MIMMIVPTTRVACLIKGRDYASTVVCFVVGVFSPSPDGQDCQSMEAINVPVE